MSNVVLISFDALRHDHLFKTRNGTEVMPFLDSVAEEEIQVDQHISTGSGTSTSFPGIHASALPLDHGYAGLNEDHRSLAERLAAGSVSTIGVTAQTSCSSIYNYDRGFDIFHDWVSEESEATDEPSLSSQLINSATNVIETTPVLGQMASQAKFQMEGLLDIVNTPPCPYPRAEEVTDTTLEIIDEEVDGRTDTFLWVHYMEPHAPYYPPADCINHFHDGRYDVGRIRRTVRKVRRARPEIIDGSMIEAVTDEETEAIRDFYAAAARYADTQARRLIENLSSRGFLDDSTILFTADHGEELLDRGTFGHRTKMYDELIRVPFIIDDRSDRLGFQDAGTSLTSHLDIAPTVTDLFGIDSPAEWRGLSLLSSQGPDSGPEDREYVLTELCHTKGLGGDINQDTLVASVRSREWKYIQNRQLETEELYDIVRDPRETTDVAAENPAIMERLRDRYESRLESVTEETREVEVSDEVEKRLRELGYAENR